MIDDKWIGIIKHCIMKLIHLSWALIITTSGAPWLLKHRQINHSELYMVSTINTMVKAMYKVISAMIAINQMVLIQTVIRAVSFSFIQQSKTKVIENSTRTGTGPSQIKNTYKIAKWVQTTTTHTEIYTVGKTETDNNKRGQTLATYTTNCLINHSAIHLLNRPTVREVINLQIILR